MAGGIWLAGSEDLNLESSRMNDMCTATGRHWMMVSLRVEDSVLAWRASGSSKFATH